MARPAPAERRRQIIEVAGRLLTEAGAGGVEIMEVARIAGVTRPVIYRQFPTRLALIQAVLDDFEAELTGRFQHALVASVGASLPVIVDAFIEACCDAIEARGAGAWILMYARSPDAESARLGRSVQDRMIAPWLPRVGELTGLAPARVRILADVVIAAGGAALDAWLDGRQPRREAVAVASRAVAALLREFSNQRG